MITLQKNEEIMKYINQSSEKTITWKILKLHSEKHGQMWAKPGLWTMLVKKLIIFHFNQEQKGDSIASIQLPQQICLILRVKIKFFTVCNPQENFTFASQLKLNVHNFLEQTGLKLEGMAIN